MTTQRRRRGPRSGALRTCVPPRELPATARTVGNSCWKEGGALARCPREPPRRRRWSITGCLASGLYQRQANVAHLSPGRRHDAAGWRPRSGCALAHVPCAQRTGATSRSVGGGADVVVERRSTAPCAAPSVTDVCVVPATSRYEPPSWSVTWLAPGSFTRTMPPAKSRRRTPFHL